MKNNNIDIVVQTNNGKYIVVEAMSTKTQDTLVSPIEISKLIAEQAKYSLTSGMLISETIKLIGDALQNNYPGFNYGDSTINRKIINKILSQDGDTTPTSAITTPSLIILSPVNDDVLKYLSYHPQELYRLSASEFEITMAEIYHKLGYHVFRTPSTHDGGKDIILTDKTLLGDFIYYVECKKFSPNTAVGVSVVRRLHGVIMNDRVNGGIIATTSYFSKKCKGLYFRK